MAEEQIIAESTPSEQPSPSIQELEALVFNQPMPQPQNAQPAAAQNQPAQESVEQPGDGNVPRGTSVEPPAAPDDQEPAEIVDVDAYFKQNFGFENEQEARQKIAQLIELQKNSATQQAAEVQFANDESRKIFDLIKDGKLKEVRDYLDAQDRLSGLESMTSEQQLKLYIKFQNPLYDDELVQDEYDSLYKINEDDFMDAEGKVDGLKMRKEKVRIAQRLDNDVKKAQEYFSSYKQKIQLPDIQVQKPEDFQEYSAYKASVAEAEKAYSEIIAPSINAITEKDASFGFKIEDANNSMNFDVGIQVDKNDLDAAKSASLNIPEWLSKSFYDETGKFLPNKLVRAVLLERNFGKYAQSIARQAVNEERKRVIASKASQNTAAQRNFTIEQQSELAEIEKYVFPGR